MEYKPQPGLTTDARIALIEQIVGGMDQRLFGNGQPGELTAIKRRLSSLEEYKWKIIGGLGALMAAVEFVFHRK